jgi:ABC-2 type transport system permease protein
VSPRITLATARRVLTQLRRDPRTIALLLAVPCVLLALLWWVLVDREGVFDSIGAPLLAIFPFIMMFVVTSVTMLRERVTGTLERLLTLPLHQLDLLVGYALAFGLAATIQALLASGLMLGPLGLDVAGPAWILTAVAVLDALLGMALGLLVSAFAATEFQAVQFMPAFVLPQVLLCGLLVPREQLPPVLEAISNVLPLSYAVDAMVEVTRSADPGSDLARDLAVVAAFGLAALALGAATLRRRTA